MGIQGLQEYLEANCPTACEEVDLREVLHGNKSTNVNPPPVLLVDTRSCLKHLYGPGTDWVCGGQWNEMLRSVENFTRSFRQQNIQIVMYFDGEGESRKLHQWIRTQNDKRQLARQILTHVMKMNCYPGKRLYFPPPVVEICLRLAFLSCGVSVCGSTGDLHKEMATYCSAEGYAGVISHHADFLIFDVPNYFSADHLKFTKKEITTVRFKRDAMLSDLQLHHDRLGLFASLLGTDFIPEEILGSFYWNLLGPDHPLAKVQVKEKHQPIFPANDIIITSVITFIKSLADSSNLPWIAQQVFRSEEVDLAEITEKLKEAVQHYSSLAQAEQPAPQSPGIAPGRKQNEHQYQKMWQHWQQHQFVPKPTTPQQKGSMVDESNSSQQIPSACMTELQQGLSALQVQDAPVVSVQLSPPEDDCQTSPVLGHHTAAISPSQILPTPPPSTETSPVASTAERDTEEVTDISITVEEESSIKGAFPDIPKRVLDITLYRLQSGVMIQTIYQVLTKAEITIDMSIEDEQLPERLPSALLYRKVRQCVYGILFDLSSKKKKDDKFDPTSLSVKEWCVYGGRRLNDPDCVEPMALDWDVPPVDKLWFSKGATADSNRLKAFLSCMMSNTPSMTQTVIVPKRLIILCCILRYLTAHGRIVLASRELDAFLAQALSPHLTTECNASNLREIKLSRVDTRAVQLASIFMSGVQAAIFANDACAVPIPWELVCPWNYFDGKLFHSKYLMATENATLMELCDGKAGRVEKLQRMRWCITEGMQADLSSPGVPTNMVPRFPGQHGDGLLPTPVHFPFGPVPPALQSVTLPNAAFFPAGANIPQMQGRGMNAKRGRGPSSRQPVSGLGGQLEVAGVPIARWGGNKAGRGYSDKERIVVGGPSSVEMGRPNRRGRGYVPRGRRGVNTTVRNVSWAIDVDKDYDRSIGYVEQPVKPRKKSTNISQVREGGDGGNDIPMIARGRGDGANDTESLAGDGLGVGMPLQGGMLPHALPGQMIPIPQTPPVQFNGQTYGLQPTPDVPHIPVPSGLDKAPGSQVPVILTKPGDMVPTGMARGRGVSIGMGGEGPPYHMPMEIVDAGSKGRGWWWEKQQQQPQPQS